MQTGNVNKGQGAKSGQGAVPYYSPLAGTVFVGGEQVREPKLLQPTNKKVDMT